MIKIPAIVKKNLPLFLLAAVGAILLILGGSCAKSKEKKEEITDYSYYTAYLEKRITALCENVDGIDEAFVLLTLDSSTENIYGESASDYIILSESGGEKAVKLCEIYPTIRGVGVVCTNGDIPRVKEKIVQLLSASLGISSSKIEVTGMK